MSLPSVARDKISNKVSLVTRPSATSVQPFQVIGASASQPQPKVIYSTFVQSTQPSSSNSIQHQQQPSQPQQQHPAYFSTTPINKPKPLSQQISIISSKTIRPPTVNKIVQLPNTSISSGATIARVQPQSSSSSSISQFVSQSPTPAAASASVPNRIQTIHFKSNVPSAGSVHPKSTIVNTVASVSRPSSSDKSPAIVPVTASTRSNLSITPLSSTTSVTHTASIKRTETNVQKVQPVSSTSSNNKAHASATTTVVKADAVKNRYRTILENLLQLKVGKK